MAQPRESANQQRALRRVLDGPPSYIVIRSLWELIESGEPLNPRWREIWSQYRAEVVQDQDAPPEVIDQIDTAISAIQAIDPGIEKLRLKAEDDICLLLGAGASAPAPSSIPVVTELLPELWRRARKLGRDDIDRLAEWCDKRNVTNIEDLLTAAYLANFAAKSGSISGLLNYFLFQQGEPESTTTRRLRVPTSTHSQVDAASVALFQETLQGLFGLLTGTMIPALPNDGHSAVVDFIKRHPRATLITTNYDGCIDEALIRADVRYSTHIGEPGGSVAIDLVKIHGSINWTYCDSCHDAREFDLLALKDGYEQDTMSYAVVGICKNCGGQRRPLLIPPMGIKFVMFPNLITLWNLARERIERASHLMVVGFSFSEADSYINKVIERSMSFNSEQVVVVCDPDASLVRRLRARFAARIDGFDVNRVLAAVGSSHEILPKVLGDLTSAPAKRKASAEKKVPQPLSK